MIISRTPYRISLFGGGTDYPAWYRKHGGAVLAAAIDKYCYLTCRVLPPFFEHRYRVVWSKIETTETYRDISHPAVRAVLERFNPAQGVEVHHVGDLPARSGMGSSSAFTVGLLQALYGLQGRMVSKHDLAMESIRLEQEVLCEPVGSQDQVTAAYGGFNHIVFHSNGEITVTPMTLPKERLEQLNAHLMLLYTGIKRTSGSVSSTYVNSLEARKRQLRIIGDLTNEAIGILNGTGDLDPLGELMREAWDAKRSLSDEVSPSEVDGHLQRALAAGAWGGKLTGAGGGGFLVLLAPPERQPTIREAFRNLLHVPFRFDWNGSQIIFATPEADYSAVELERQTLQLDPFRERDVAEAAHG